MGSLWTLSLAVLYLPNIYAMAYNSFPGFGYIILYVYLSNIVGGLTEVFVYSIILKRIST